jgi:protein-S-isoprenylcysteine O-methyltransferase Ste14
VTHTDHPQVKVPAPLIYFLANAGGALLEWTVPWSVRVPRWVGAALILLGIGFALWAVKSLAQAHTHVDPAKPTTALVDTGPYRISRNPIYVAMTLSSVGMTLLLQTLWIGVLIIPVIWIMNRYVILPEEQYLLVKFGAAYAAYCKRVRRWL